MIDPSLNRPGFGDLEKDRELVSRSQEPTLTDLLGIGNAWQGDG